MNTIDRLSDAVEKIRLDNENQSLFVKSNKQRSEEFFIGVQRRLFGDSPSIEAVSLNFSNESIVF